MWSLVFIQRSSYTTLICANRLAETGAKSARDVPRTLCLAIEQRVQTFLLQLGQPSLVAELSEDDPAVLLADRLADHLLTALCVQLDGQLVAQSRVDRLERGAQWLQVAVFPVLLYSCQ